MTCPAILTVQAGSGWLSTRYQVPCCRKKAHPLAGPHEPDISKLPLTFIGEPGVWALKIRLAGR